VKRGRAHRPAGLRAEARRGLRITGGQRRGKKLFSVAGLATRPTSARVRESIFGILAGRVQDAAVLDLYAGTGILGMEALSRGARYSLFVDNAPAAVTVIQKNLATCRFDSRAKVLRCDLERNYHWLTPQPGYFSLVLMDPPYHRNLISGTLERLHASAALAPGAWIVAEHAATEPLALSVREIAVTDQRRYGKTLVSFLEYRKDGIGCP